MHDEPLVDYHTLAYGDEPRTVSQETQTLSNAVLHKAHATHSAERPKHVYLRAHAKTGASDWNLAELGELPVSRIGRTVRPDRLTVPRASTANSVSVTLSHFP